jgi:hypothetical protein
VACGKPLANGTSDAAVKAAVFACRPFALISVTMALLHIGMRRYAVAASFGQIGLENAAVLFDEWLSLQRLDDLLIFL